MEQFQVDKTGFNVIEIHPSGGMATVATLQPHARIKERTVLFAAAPDLLAALEAITEQWPAAFEALAPGFKHMTTGDQVALVNHFDQAVTQGSRVAAKAKGVKE